MPVPPYTISTTRAGAHYEPARTVYVLSKGQNAGKPGRKPWANSFAIVCADEDTAGRLFGLLFALHRADAFGQHLVGSVIPFLRLGELRDILRERVHLLTDSATGVRLGKLSELISKCDALDVHRDALRKAVRHYARAIVR